MSKAKPRSRTTKTKAEIESALDDVTDKLDNQEKLSPKELQAKLAREKDLLALVQQKLSPEKVAEAVTKSRFEIDRIMSNVSDLLISKTNELRDLSEAIAIEKNELETLHGKDIIVSAIDVLVSEHEAKMKQFVDETEERRIQWANEQAIHNKVVAERDAERQKQWQREEAEYVYNTKLKHRAIEDEFNEKINQLQKAEAQRKDLLERDWSLRNEQLRQREAEFAEYKAKVEKFPQELDAAVKREVSIVGNSMKRDHQHELALIVKDREAKEGLLHAQLSAAQATVVELNKTIHDLQNKLAEATTKVTEVANKAIDGASGQLALKEVRDALAQREVNGPTKRS